MFRPHAGFRSQDDMEALQTILRNTGEDCTFWEE